MTMVRSLSRVIARNRFSRAQAAMTRCLGRMIGLEMRATDRVCVPAQASATSMLL